MILEKDRGAAAGLRKGLRMSGKCTRARATVLPGVQRTMAPAILCDDATTPPVGPVFSGCLDHLHPGGSTSG